MECRLNGSFHDSSGWPGLDMLIREMHDFGLQLDSILLLPHSLLTVRLRTSTPLFSPYSHHVPHALSHHHLHCWLLRFPLLASPSEPIRSEEYSRGCRDPFNTPKPINPTNHPPPPTFLPASKPDCSFVVLLLQ